MEGRIHVSSNWRQQRRESLMVSSEDVTHKSSGCNLIARLLLLMLSVLPASSLILNSPLDQRKAVGLTRETERLILRRDEARETMQLGQRSQIVRAKLISQKILTPFPSPFPKATLDYKGVQNVEMKIICMICLIYIQRSHLPSPFYFLRPLARMC